MKILIIGISVRAMAESAVRSGYDVIALDAFGDRDLKDITEAYSLHRDYETAYSPDSLYNASLDLSFDAVAYTSNLENFTEILARFGKSHKVIGNSPKVVASVRNWAGLFERLRNEGFSVPETIFAGENQLADSRRKWLLKPMLSGGGHGIRFYNLDTEYPFDNKIKQGAPGYMLQEYIPGRPCSASFVANTRDCTVLGITEQLIGVHPFGSRDFQYCGNLLPVPEMLDPDSGEKILDEVCRLSEFLTLEYGLTGANGIDFILKDGRVYLTEVNPRYSASMEIIEIAYGLPVFHLHLQSVLDGKLPEFDPWVELKCGKSCGKGYIYAGKDITMPDTDGWYATGIRDVPESGEKIRKDGPVCTIITERSTREEVLAEMIYCTEELKGMLYG